MNAFCLILLGTAVAATSWGARGERLVGTYEWGRAPVGIPRGAEVRVIEGRRSVVIHQTNDLPLRVQILNLESPAITGTRYSVRGEIRYRGVRGAGYLEMWSHFPPVRPGMPGQPYFSKTLADSGEMGRISGDSEWRRFQLPFDRTGTDLVPTRLEVALVLPSVGEVEVGTLELVDYGAERATSGPRAWWSRRTANLVGSLAGTLLGCLGGLLGILAEKGKARSFVLITLSSFLVVGVLGSVVGLAALVAGQPFEVWFFPLLTGVLLVAIPLPMRSQMRRRYAEVELRRIASADVSGRPYSS